MGWDRDPLVKAVSVPYSLCTGDRITPALQQPLQKGNAGSCQQGLGMLHQPGGIFRSWFEAIMVHRSVAAEDLNTLITTVALGGAEMKAKTICSHASV